jgi:hypothetical protein
MDKKEKAKRINKIEAGLIDIIGYDRYDSEDYEQQKISAIKILAKRPGERIDKALREVNTLKSAKRRLKHWKNAFHTWIQNNHIHNYAR